MKPQRCRDHQAPCSGLKAMNAGNNWVPCGCSGRWRCCRPRCCCSLTISRAACARRSTSFILGSRMKKSSDLKYRDPAIASLLQAHTHCGSFSEVHMLVTLSHGSPPIHNMAVSVASKATLDEESESVLHSQHDHELARCGILARVSKCTLRSCTLRLSGHP